MFLAAFQSAQPSPEKQRAVDEATVEQRRAVRLRPHDASAYSELGAAYHGHKFMAAASAAYEVAISLRPTDADGYRNFGMSVRATGDTAAALRAYDTTLTLRPSDGVAHFSRGNVLRGAQERIGAYRLAVRHLPGHHGARTNLLRLLRSEQRAAEVQGRYRGGTGEIWGRYRGDTGEIYRGVQSAATRAARRGGACS
jgi:tetratricopeptide (TPR) repeat protein